MLHLLTYFPIQLMNINAIKQTCLPIMQDVQIRIKRIKDDKINQACPYLPIQNIWIIKNIY